MAADRDLASAQLQPEVHSVRGHRDEGEHTRERLSKAFSDGTTQHIQRQGRWPANVVHDGGEEVLAGFPATQSNSGEPFKRNLDKFRNTYGAFAGEDAERGFYGDSGSAARFFYCAKADSGDRLGSKHPTVKPVDLMRWLCRLVTPPGGTVLDPFAGSGSTGMACLAEGFDAVLIEREAQFVADIKRRIAHVSGADAPLFACAPETEGDTPPGGEDGFTASSRTNNRTGRIEAVKP